MADFEMHDYFQNQLHLSSQDFISDYKSIAFRLCKTLLAKSIKITKLLANVVIKF